MPGSTYLLEVFHPGETTPIERHTVARAADVLELIPRLLESHPGCERVVVMMGQTRLFAVDCTGNRLAD
jgi:hypothetical protein